MLYNIALGFAGFILLALSSYALVVGSASIALRYELPKHLVGMTIVALGTALPETMVAAFGSFLPTNDLSVGTIIGANITNMGLILGLACIFRPVKIDPEVIKTEYILLLGITIGVGALLLNYQLGAFDGIILLIMLASVLYWLATSTNKYAQMQLQQVTESKLYRPQDSLKKSIILVVFGLVVLPLSAMIAIQSVLVTAASFNVSILYAGLFMSAIGASLPEIAITITSLIRREKGIMLGTLIGTNIFNLLVALPFPAFFAASALSQQIIYRDVAFMIFITVLPFIKISSNLEGPILTKQKGYMLVGFYLFYFVFTTIAEHG